MPTKRDRETCLCKLHENANLLISRLHHMKLLPTGCVNAEACVKLVVCENPSQRCYERKCGACKEKLSTKPDTVNGDTLVSWFQWKSMSEERTIKGKNVM